MWKIHNETKQTLSFKLFWIIEKQLVNLQSSSMPRTLRYEIDRRITDALSRWSISSDFIGKLFAKSVKISVSRERRQRAASRDFSLRFSLFLKRKEMFIKFVKLWKKLNETAKSK